MPPLRECHRDISRPRHGPLCRLNVDCCCANICSGTTTALKRVTSMRSTLSRGTCLRVKLTCLGLGREGETHVTFRRTTGFDFSPGMGRRTLCGCTLYVRRASCSPFTRSMAIFRHFLGRFPGSPCARHIGSCLVRICVGAHDCRTTLGSVTGVRRPNAHVVRTGRGVLFQLNARTFTGTHFRRTLRFFGRSLTIKRCGRTAGTSTCF